MSDPAAYHSKLAEAIHETCENIAHSGWYVDRISHVLASWGVIDPKKFDAWARLYEDRVAEVSRLKADLATSRETHVDAVGVIAGLRAEAKQMHAQISRLQALCSSTGTGRPFFPG